LTRRGTPLVKSKSKNGYVRSLPVLLFAGSNNKGGKVKRFHGTRAVTVLPCHRVTGTDAVSLLKCSRNFCSTPKADIGLRRNI
jgi:hypothetical protein